VKAPIPKYPFKKIDLVEAFYKENVNLNDIIKPVKVGSVQSFSLKPYTGEWSKKQKRHLLNRALVGVSKKELDLLDNLSMEQAVALVLPATKKPDPPVNNYYADLFDDPLKTYGYEDVPKGKTWVDEPEDQNRRMWQRTNSLMGWIFQNMVEQKPSIHWKLFLFLHNLLPIRFDNVQGNKSVYQYVTTLFEGAFMSYKELIYNITVDPGMLMFLNLTQSHKDAPDENYARELQELYTVGKGPNSKYTEKDVTEMARLLTGWRVNWETFQKKGKVEHTYHEWAHDEGDKQFSAFYGNKVIKGRKGQDGRKELDEALDMIFSVDETSLFICRRLYQFFVYPVIDSTTEESVIKPLAIVFKQNNFSLIKVLEVLLKSEHFYQESFFNSMIKSPVEFYAGFLKELPYEYRWWKNNDPLPEKHKDILVNQYKFYCQNMQWRTSNIGMQIGYPPNVSGWPAYYQAPAYDLFWINSNTIKERVSGISDTYAGFWIDDSFSNRVNWVKYVSSFKDPSNLTKVIEEIIERLIPIAIPSNVISRMKTAAIGNLSETYWTDEWNKYKNSPTQENTNTLDNRLQNMFRLLLQIGEIHIF
jgi:hypothetical protein